MWSSVVSLRFLLASMQRRLRSLCRAIVPIIICLIKAEDMLELEPEWVREELLRLTT